MPAFFHFVIEFFVFSGAVLVLLRLGGGSVIFLPGRGCLLSCGPVFSVLLHASIFVMLAAFLCSSV